ncbi:transposase [Cucumis melo var. makuwa]|uniref:Transposase n=1 Tax=Cucumis melo var. makuwa TaxID=1194695 RepID=A0A5A7TSR4_CUCMM|nr:transposase [Cucumis melo var. makuwa]
MSFYGVIEEIWELNYNSFKVVIFKCDWVENSGGIKTDKLGFVLVDLSRDEILDKSPNDESPNDALSQALDTLEYGGRVRGMGGFIAPTIYFHQAKPRKSNKVDTTQQIIDENEALCKRIRELEQKVQNIPTSKHGSCSKSKVQENMVVVSKERVLENVVKEKKEIATSVRPTSLTSKKKVVKEDEVKEEEVIVTRPSISKNKVKALRPMTKEVEVTSEPFNLPIQLKYILSMLKGDRWSLVVINPYDDVVYHLDSLRTSSRDDIKYVTNMVLTIFQSQKNLNKTRKTTFWKAVKCLLQVGTVECGYYVMRYMREIVDRRNSYSQLELGEIQVE